MKKLLLTIFNANNQSIGLKGVINAILLLFLLFGCASVPAPAGRSIAENEEKRIRNSFTAMTERQQDCFCCVDSGVEVTWKSPFASGQVDGFLQAKAPSFLRFVEVNPLGQPWIILTTDGKSFAYLPVYEGTLYEGDVNAQLFTTYAPSGLDPQHFFYLLTGRVVPGPFHILDSMRHKTLHQYWLTYTYEESGDGLRHHALYDPKTQRLKEYVLEGAGGDILLKARYVYHWASKTGDSCVLPMQVIFSFPGQFGEAEVRFRDPLPDVAFSALDFKIEPPEGFTRVLVQ